MQCSLHCLFTIYIIHVFLDSTDYIPGRINHNLQLLKLNLVGYQCNDNKLERHYNLFSAVPQANSNVQQWIMSPFEGDVIFFLCHLQIVMIRYKKIARLLSSSLSFIYSYTHLYMVDVLKLFINIQNYLSTYNVCSFFTLCLKLHVKSLNHLC